MCVGSAVGAGILRTPGEIAQGLQAGHWILAVWVLGAVVAILDVLILAEMAASVPRVGGLVAYIHLSYGPSVAFVAGWVILLVTWPGSIASVAVAAGEILAGGAESLATGAEPSALGRTITVAIIVGLGGLNLLGLRFGARLEVALNFGKVALLAGVFLAAAVAAPAAPAPTVAPSVGIPVAGAFVGAMVAVLFSYDGYADAIYMAGETRDPGRALPRAILLSLGTITALYLLANVVFLHALGAEGMSRSKFVALDLVERAFGSPGGVVLTAVAAFGMIGAINSYLLTGPRIARLLAEERLALPIFGRVSAAGSPVFATCWLVAVSVPLALTQTFGELLELTVPLIWATNLCVAAGLWIQRVRAPERPRPFRVRWMPFVVGGQLLLGAAFFVSAAWSNPMSLAVDAAVVAAGFALFAILRRVGSTRAR